MPTPALPPPPDGRFHLAFPSASEPMLTWEPTWTRIDDFPNLVTSYTIDRGRQYELDRTDTGRAVVEIIDPDGILDPTNASGPFHGKIEPLLQAMLGRRNPITGDWVTRYRGFIEEFDYAYHPSQRVTMLTVQLVDIFEILAAIEMQPAQKAPGGSVKPGTFGDLPPAKIKAQDVVFFDKCIGLEAVRLRLEQVVNLNAGIPDDFCVFFSGNVDLWETTYSPGENVLSVVQDCADAEFPGVGNVYTDRFGRLCFHGRLARFTPEDISGEAGPGRWDWHTWDVGDGTAVRADPANCAQIREFAYDRGLAKVINSCSATPMWSPRSTASVLKELSLPEINGQLVTDDTSIGKRGIRSQSFQNLQTMGGQLDPDTNSLQETRRFATYYVANYAKPHNRVTAIGFRSIGETTVGAAKTWELLTTIDISDGMTVTVGAAGGGGFLLEPFYVEGIHEECRMLTPEMDDVTIHLDLSPRSLYSIDPWA